MLKSSFANSAEVHNSPTLSPPEQIFNLSAFLKCQSNFFCLKYVYFLNFKGTFETDTPIPIYTPLKKNRKKNYTWGWETDYLNVSSCQIQNPQVGPGNNILNKTNKVKTNILLHSSEIELHQGKCLKCPLETDGSCLQHLQFAQLEQIWWTNVVQEHNSQ